MEGFCETNNFSPKWQSLKFAEILVWRGVSDHFQHLDIVVIWYICHRRQCGARIPSRAHQPTEGWSVISPLRLLWGIFITHSATNAGIRNLIALSFA